MNNPEVQVLVGCKKPHIDAMNNPEVKVVMNCKNFRVQVLMR
jgi:hypothetical protein